MRWRAEIHQINIKDGDSALIKLYSINTSNVEKLEKAILIDAGRLTYATRIHDYLKKELAEGGGSYKQLDAIVITHYDDDHAGGIEYLFKKPEFKDNFLGDAKNPTLLYDQGDGDDPAKDAGRINVKRPYNRNNLVEDLINDGKIDHLTLGPNVGNKMLGFELLWGTRKTYDAHIKPIGPIDIKDGKSAKKKDIPGLRSKMAAADRNKPALFCIGVNEEILKPTKTVLGISDTPYSAANKRSIALILVSPQNEILHYTAGDLNEANEMLVADWTRGQGYTYDADSPGVYSMKLSHHGSEGSTPLKLMESLKPEWALISAGNRHFHPRPDIVYFLYLYNLYMQRFLSKKIRMRQPLSVGPFSPLATNCPSYLKTPGRMAQTCRQITNTEFGLVNTLIENDSQYGNETKCKLIVKKSKTDRGTVDIKPAAYLRLKDKKKNNGGLYYGSILEAITLITNDTKILTAFDTKFNIKPTDDMEMDLSEDELAQITKITKHKHMTLEREFTELYDFFKEKDVTNYLNHFRGIWDSMAYPRTDFDATRNFYPVDEAGKLRKDSVIVKLEINASGFFKNGKVTHSEILNAPPPPKSTKGTKRGRSRSTTSRKRRRGGRITTFFTSFSASDTRKTILSSTATQTGDFTLAPNCSLDKFVRYLPDGLLVLENYKEKKGTGTNVIIEGDVADELSSWFNDIEINHLHVYIPAKRDGNTLTVEDKKSRVHFDAIIEKDKLGTDEIKFSGLLQKDDTLVFNLASKNSKTNLLKNAKFVGMIDELDNDSFVQIIQAWFGEQLTFPLDEQTEIYFNPKNQNNTDVILVSRVDKPLKFLKRFSLEEISFVLEDSTRASIDDWITQDSGCSFDAKLKYTAEGSDSKEASFSADISASLHSNGDGNFLFKPEFKSSDDPLQPITDLLKIFLANSVGELTHLSSFIRDCKFDLKLLDGVNVNFKNGQVVSVDVYSQAHISNFKLAITLSFPDCSISGLLVEDALVESKDGEDPMSQFTFGDVLSGHGVPDFSGPKEKLADFKLTEFHFSAAPKYGDYSFGASLMDDKQGIWSFNDEITLEDLSIQINKQPNSVEAGLEAAFRLGNAENKNIGETTVTLKGAYKCQQGQKSQWNFSADIAVIDIIRLIYLFPQDFRDLIKKVLPSKLEFFDIALALNMNYQNSGKNTFLLQGKANIADEIFSVEYDSGLDDAVFRLHWENQSTKMNLLSLLKTICRKEDNFLLNIDEDLISINLRKIDIYLSSISQNLVIEVVTENGRVTFINQSELRGSDPYQALQALYFSLMFDIQLPRIPVVGSIPFPIEKIELLKISRPLTAKDVSQLKSRIPLFDEKVKTVDKLLQLAFTPKKEITSNKLFLPLSSEPSQSTLRMLPTSASPSNTTDQPKWFDIQKSLGALSVKRLGLDYKNSQMWLLFDTSLIMGGLTIELLGLSVGFKLTQLAIPNVKLDGLGIGYQSGPLTISGGFLRDQTEGEERYSGTAVVRTDGLNLSAMGSYSQIKIDGKNTTKPSLFIFVRLNKPLGGPPYFYVTGLSGGFGYNQWLRVPKQEEVVNFPLVQGTSGRIGNSDEPFKVLTTLLQDKWLVAKLGEQWLAFGVDFTTFKLVSTRALATVGLGSELQISLLGRSEMRLPMAFVEMGLRAYCNPSRGVLELSALLGPNSYVLHPDCHLTGGFAFHTWFSGQYAGDFALTVGGYHPRYSPPSHYPTAPRIGFNWKVDSHTTIKGEAYFALVPSCVMAGGGLEAAYQDGDLRAWFRAYANFLIHWRPFYYEADMDVSVGASYRLNLLFTSTTVSVELGASVELYGPPTSGTAHVRWWVISFTVHFGEDRKPVPALTWDEFKELLPKDKSGTLILNRISVKKGLLTEKPDNNWVIRPDDLEIETESAIPASTITFIAADKNTDFGLIKEDDHTVKNSSPLFIKPMKSTSLNNTHKVTIKAPGSVIPDWKTHILTRNVPEALWGIPSAESPSLNSQRLLSDYWVGLSIKAPNSEQGPIFGPIEMKKAFGDISLATTTVQTLPTSPAFNPTQEPKIAEIIRDEMSTEAAVKKRNEAVDILRKIGLFKAPDTLDPLAILAVKIDEIFTDLPLKILKNN